MDTSEIAPFTSKRVSPETYKLGYEFQSVVSGAVSDSGSPLFPPPDFSVNTGLFLGKNSH